ncbi:MAG: hypothetical protein ACI8UP_001990, partial [Porticoccaceae bacterium]
SVLVAIAVAMAGRILPNADDLLLQQLIQPSKARYSLNNSNVGSKILEEL